ncbi:MAG: hypothetical protein QF486_01550 [Candidatus Woesearchaeota archaeon]|nr:hypothetical protein [Candidatus Woesearchaeota archaeon]MDP7198278.1 hypothetical protein [Candidatus Woesearchaeota archaeon]MDP7467380.1 hypothetical protein [Candidatus Woesearchaeota archaeon]MDP7647607.1 hypothetical protein [Candidatus Woesearchaeota archaeon]
MTPLTTMMTSVSSMGKSWEKFYEWSLGDGSGRSFARGEAKILCTKIDSDPHKDTAMKEAHDLVRPKIDAEFARMGVPLYIQSSRSTSAWVPVVTYEPADEGCVPGPILVLKSVLSWGSGKDYGKIFGGVDEKDCVPVHRGSQSMMSLGGHILYAYPVEVAAHPGFMEPDIAVHASSLAGYSHRLPRETSMALWDAEHRR